MLARGIALAIILPARGITRGIVASVPAMKRAGVTVSAGSETIARGVGNAIFALSKETLRGSAITLIPAAAIALGIWFFAIRTPPARKIVEQKPVTLRNQPPQGQSNLAWVAPTVAKPAPPAQPAMQPTIESKPPPPPQGGLSIATDPPGAKVIVDGSIVKTSPASISDLPVGKHHLQIVLNDYNTEERDVDVKADETLSQGTITLRRTAPLQMAAVPKPAQPTSTTVAANNPEEVAVSKKPARVKPRATPVTQKPASTATRQAAAAVALPPPKPTPKPASTPSQKPQRAFEGGVPGG
jgi:hypothetical protein